MYRKRMILTLLTAALVTVPAFSSSAENTPSSTLEMKPMGLNFLPGESRNARGLHKAMRKLGTEHYKRRVELQRKIDRELHKRNPSERRLQSYAEEMSNIELSYQQKRTQYLMRFKSVLGDQEFKRAMRQKPEEEKQVSVSRPGRRRITTGVRFRPVCPRRRISISKRRPFFF
ncbi:hypothetical protein QA601_03190 [Chitinispirillales bacterium ANBcel5]|uniref:hypothetical protein n=1 Tax=Cellulosispirillum alkaliphilum TaxID=3039283 RepID=UPI002A554605|nr:hypothetical protein [Chitinispirillales bacterium ANBcel5]